MKTMGRIAAAAFAAAGLIGRGAAAAPGDVVTAPYPIATQAGTPDVAVAANGTAVYVWVGPERDLVHVRIDQPAGVAAASFSIAGHPQVQVLTPSVAVDAAGRFVVAWAEQSGSYPYYLYRIFLRRFAADGTALSPVVAVDDSAAANFDQIDPDVSMNAAGQFVVSWSTLQYQSSGNSLLRVTQGPIMMRRYSSAGLASAVQTVASRESGYLNISPSLYPALDIFGRLQYASKGPSVSIGSAGETVVAWTAGFVEEQRIYSLVSTAPLLGGGLQTVYAQRFDASGLTQGKRITIDSALTNAHEIYDPPSVAWAPDGGFVVAYDRNDALRSAALSRGIYFKHVDAAGTVPRNATEVQRGPSPFCCQTTYDGSPAVAVHSGGGFVVAWRNFGPESAQQSPSPSISAQVYASDGSAIGTATFASDGIQSRPGIAMRGDGDCVLSWGHFDNSTSTVSAAIIDGP
ncbi:hypothetical protein [Solimonas terrae]|uniref:Uncharacterized protein n=1 Tax=Solimonas terrae TaxID=1396819 RepID=A0A6M2BW58_9GAMM|nr:hypothetical protein [Solimonas terrae]NGY06373.1 hypothetical protein [Solimonas terrae]